MRFLSVLFLLTSTKSFLIPWNGIDQTNVPICKNCRFGVVPENSNMMLCSLFGKMSVVTGEITWSAATNVRANSSQCGPEGKLYAHYLSE